MKGSALHYYNSGPGAGRRALAQPRSWSAPRPQRALVRTIVPELLSAPPRPPAEDVTLVAARVGEVGDGPYRIYDPELGSFLQRDPLPVASKLRISALSAGGIYARTILQGRMTNNLDRMFRRNRDSWQGQQGLSISDVLRLHHSRQANRRILRNIYCASFIPLQFDPTGLGNEHGDPFPGSSPLPPPLMFLLNPVEILERIVDGAFEHLSVTKDTIKQYAECITALLGQGAAGLEGVAGGVEGNLPAIAGSVYEINSIQEWLEEHCHSECYEESVFKKSFEYGDWEFRLPPIPTPPIQPHNSPQGEAWYESLSDSQIQQLGGGGFLGE